MAAVIHDRWAVVFFLKGWVAQVAPSRADRDHVPAAYPQSPDDRPVGQAGVEQGDNRVSGGVGVASLVLPDVCQFHITQTNTP